jgi:hypothetical protein
VTCSPASSAPCSPAAGHPGRPAGRRPPPRRGRRHPVRRAGPRHGPACRRGGRGRPPQSEPLAAGLRARPASMSLHTSAGARWHPRRHPLPHHPAPVRRDAPGPGPGHPPGESGVRGHRDVRRPLRGHHHRAQRRPRLPRCLGPSSADARRGLRPQPARSASPTPICARLTACWCATAAATSASRTCRDDPGVLISETELLGALGVEHFTHLDTVGHVMSPRPHTVPATAGSGPGDPPDAPVQHRLRGSRSGREAGGRIHLPRPDGPAVTQCADQPRSPCPR